MSRSSDHSNEEINMALAAFAQEGGRRKQTEKLLRSAGLKISFNTLKSWAYDVYKERYQGIRIEVEKVIRTRMADQFHRLAQESTELSEDVLNRIRETLRRHDGELAEVNERIGELNDELHSVEAALDSAHAQLAESLQIDTVEALIEDILEEGEGPAELDPMLLAALRGGRKRRNAIVEELQTLWDRRSNLEVGFKDLAKLLHESGVMGGIASEKHQLFTGQPTQIVENNFSELQRALAEKGVKLVIGQGQQPQPPKPVPALSVGDDDGRDT